jgi:hypothetical protein
MGAEEVLLCHFLFILAILKAFKGRGEAWERGRWINKKSMMGSSQLHMGRPR